jgi:transposase
LTQHDRKQLLNILQQSPQDFGYFNTEWTVGLLQEHVSHSFDKDLSEDTLRRELQRLEYVWKRPRRMLDPDPQLRGKKAADSSADPAVATAKCVAGRGRD